MPDQSANIEPAKVERKARLGLTLGQIATLLKCSKSLLRERFAEELKLGRAKYLRDLRRFQYQCAKKGTNGALLIHLGKCELKQTTQQLQRRVPEPDIHHPLE